VWLSFAQAGSLNIGARSLFCTCPTKQQASKLSATLLVATAHEDCSCFNSSSTLDCCDQRILRGHKFGYLLTQELFKKPFQIVTSKIRPSYIYAGDYRHVVVARNIYQAVASGYLYHQSGHECWLTFNGDSRIGMGLEEKVFYWQLHVPNMPPPKNRSICTYVKEESLEHGMHAYIDVALHKCYSGIFEYWNQVQEDQRETGINRTMLVCFEALLDPTQQKMLFYDIMDWLFPGGHEYKMPVKHPHHYSGGHSTSHDAKLRRNLTSLVKRLDAQVFNHSLSEIQALFECGSDND